MLRRIFFLIAVVTPALCFIPASASGQVIVTGESTDSKEGDKPASQEYRLQEGDVVTVSVYELLVSRQEVAGRRTISEGGHLMSADHR